MNTHADYLGFGTSSHSFVNGKRWWNYSSLKMYLNAVGKNDHAIRGFEKLNSEQILNEYVMLSLRSKGLDIEKVKILSDSWYFEKKKIIDSFISESYLEEEQNIIRCTQKGYLICDEIINKIL